MQDNPPRNQGQVHDRELLEIAADLCCFVMHEVINPREIFFFYKHSVLAMETRYLGLREWENKKHHASASSVGKQEKNMHSSFNFNDVLY